MRGELEGFSLILVLPDYQRAEFPFLVRILEVRVFC
jgi:hypothetical protein